MTKKRDDANKLTKNRLMKVLVILGIIILPLVYSFFYLSAFWDPYHTLDQVPVAVVNLDECDKSNETDSATVCQGEELVNQLIENGTFDFQLVDEATADEGLVDENYYAVIKIPANFTSALNSATEIDKIHPVITYAPNTKSNYLASQLINAAVKEVKAKVNSEVATKIVSGLSDKLSETPNQLTQINDAFGTLSSGATTLAGGANELASGINQLHTNYQNFNTGLADLDAGTTKLASGSETYAAALTQYETLSSQFTTDMATNFSAIVAYATEHPNALMDENFRAAYTVAKTYTTPLEKYGGKTLLELNSAASTGVTSGYTELAKGISEVSDGAKTLSTNSATILTGIETLDNGASEVAFGAEKITDGINTAKETLSEKIADATNEVKKLEGLDEYAGEAAIVETKEYGEVDAYGIFFAPYFISLSLWVGGILILMGLYYDPDGRFKVLGRNSSNRGLRLVFYNIIGIIQALLLGFLLKLTLGFTVTDIWLYYGTCILISEAFLAIIMFLFFIFKDVGKFLSIVFLVIQLAACGGTFPVETEPAFYQAVYPFMPMTYSVDLLRESFVSINAEFLWRDVSILLAILVIFNLAIFIFGIYRKAKTKQPKNILTS